MSVASGYLATPRGTPSSPASAYSAASACPATSRTRQYHRPWWRHRRADASIVGLLDARV